MSGVLSFACEFRAEAEVTAAPRRPLPSDQVPCTEGRNVHLVGEREEKVSVRWMRPSPVNLLTVCVGGV